MSLDDIDVVVVRSLRRGWKKTQMMLEEKKGTELPKATNSAIDTQSTPKSDDQKKSKAQLITAQRDTQNNKVNFSRAERPALEAGRKGCMCVCVCVCSFCCTRGCWVLQFFGSILLKDFLVRVCELSI